MPDWDLLVSSPLQATNSSMSRGSPEIILGHIIWLAFEMEFLNRGVVESR